jgi:hypothetical protein
VDKRVVKQKKQAHLLPALEVKSRNLQKAGFRLFVEQLQLPNELSRQTLYLQSPQRATQQQVWRTGHFISTAAI